MLAAMAVWNSSWRLKRASWVLSISESRSASAESIAGQSILSDLDERRGLRCSMAEVQSSFINLIRWQKK